MKSPRSQVKSVKKTTADSKPKSKTQSKADRTSSVERTFKILEELATNTRLYGLTFTELRSELARREKIPHGSMSNLLHTLNRLGYLHYNKEKKLHSLGIRLINLGVMAQKRLQKDQRDEDCQDLLKRVVFKTNLGAHIAFLDTGYAVYLLREEAPGFFGAKIFPGKPQVPHFTAVGKALICCLSEDRLRDLLSLHEKASGGTAKSITTFPRLAEELAAVRERGYAIDDQEHEKFVMCVAAPIYSGDGRVIASIGVSTRTTEHTLEQLEKLGATILKSFAEEAATKPRILNALNRYYSISNVTIPKQTVLRDR